MEVLEETKTRLLAVDCLKSMKQQKTFRKLSSELSLSAGMLNRYVNGYVLPKSGRAGHLINFFIRTYLPRILESSKIKGSRYIVTAEILSQPFLLNVIAFKALQNLKVKPDVVLTAAADGIPVAQALANLLGVRFVYAKLTQEFAFCDHYASKNATSRPIVSPFFLPKSLLKKNESVLIADDVIRGGGTFEALTSICSQARARITSIFSMFISRSACKELKKRHDVFYLVLIDD